MQYTGERLSFFKLFSEKRFKLIVPIIQRDYAQGRTSEDTTEVRNEFVDALYSYLKEGVPGRDLDFVYGTLRRTKSAIGDSTTCFIPLDGQQRLTTLFLLHWYLVQISDNKELKSKFKANLIKDGRSLFSYETRQSSTDFCDSLMQAEIDFSSLKKIKDDKEKDIDSLSETLKNQRWFYRNWTNDPTIMSMLVMLDTLHAKFNGKKEFLPLLLDEENPVITFIFLDLDEYKLTDDLYIKMNSRGLPLSKFENLKAKLEQHLRTLKFDDKDLKNRKFKLFRSSKEEEVTPKDYFSYNIDTKWTTLFWYYARLTSNPRVIDTYIENFIRIVVTNAYARTVKFKGKAYTTPTFDLLSGKDSVTYSKYEQTGVLTPEAMIAVMDAMDALYAGTNGIHHYISDDYRFYFDEDEIFRKVIENDLSRPERMQFYAYVEYLIRYKDRIEGINEWMRVIHNLTNPENTVTDSNLEFSQGIKSIDRLLDYAPDILTWLRTNPSIERFAGHQVFEEVVKALLISDEKWKLAIESTEKHDYFVGQIGFMLSFAGVIDYYRQNQDKIISSGRFTWNGDEDTDTFVKFANYARISKFIFHLENKERVNDLGYCFERAVLTQGDYLLQWGNWNSWNLLSTETVAKNVKRDYSWRRLLRVVETPKADDEDIVKQGYVKSVMDAVGTHTDINASLLALCDDYQGQRDWRYCLIKSSDMVDYSKKGWMYFSPDGDEVILLGHWYLNMYHVELFTYYLWATRFNWEFMHGRFEGKYAEQKRGDILPSILIEGFTYKHRRYLIEITAEVDDYELEGFCISFYDNNTDHFEYPEEILSVLSDMEFSASPDEESNAYIIEEANPDKVYEVTLALCDALDNLKIIKINPDKS